MPSGNCPWIARLCLSALILPSITISLQSESRWRMILTIEVQPLDHDPDEPRRPGCMIMSLSECVLWRTRRVMIIYTYRVDDGSLFPTWLWLAGCCLKLDQCVAVSKASFSLQYCFWGCPKVFLMIITSQSSLKRLTIHDPVVLPVPF